MADTVRKLLSLLVPVLTQTLLALVCCHLMPFMLLSVWHNKLVLDDIIIYYFFTSFTKTFAGLKAGML